VQLCLPPAAPPSLTTLVAHPVPPSTLLLCAAQWADRCTSQHAQGPDGENIGWWGPNSNLKDVAGGWYREVSQPGGGGAPTSPGGGGGGGGAGGGGGGGGGGGWLLRAGGAASSNADSFRILHYASWFSCTRMLV